jgi:hypothetical protein
MPDVAKLIGEAFELGAVILDGEIALLNRAKLCFQENDTLELIVMGVTLNVK